MKSVGNNISREKRFKKKLHWYQYSASPVVILLIVLFRISSTKASGKCDAEVRSMVSTQVKLNTAGRKNISKIISLLANIILFYLTV